MALNRGLLWYLSICLVRELLSFLQQHWAYQIVLTAFDVCLPLYMPVDAHVHGCIVSAYLTLASNDSLDFTSLRTLASV